MTFDEWYAKLPNAIPHGHEAQMRFAWDAAIRASPSEAVERDAARYRWLRENIRDGNVWRPVNQPELFDAAIDAALSRSAVEGGRGGDGQT